MDAKFVSRLGVPVAVFRAAPSLHQTSEVGDAVGIERGCLLRGCRTDERRHHWCHRGFHRGREKSLGVAPRLQMCFEFDRADAAPPSGFHGFDLLGAVRHAGREDGIAWCRRHRRIRCITRRDLRKFADRLPSLVGVEHRLGEVIADRSLDDQIGRGRERSQGRLMAVISDDAKQSRLGRPRAPVTLGDQLITNPQTKTGDVGVGDEPLPSAARVVAQLEHRIDVLTRQLEHVPGLESRSCGQAVRRDVHGVPAAVVVEDDHFGRTAREQALGCGDGVRLDARFTGLPVLRSVGEDFGG